MSDQKPREGGLTRLSFIKAAGGAAAGVGAAAIGVPGLASTAEAKGVPTEPSTPNPAEPVVAYVRDAAKGEVTVMHGTSEMTYRDRALVKRLLSSAPRRSDGKAGE